MRDRVCVIGLLAMVGACELPPVRVSGNPRFEFTEAQRHPVGVHPNGLELVDLDLDGDLDLVVPGLVTAELTVFENLGDRRFVTATSSPLASGVMDLSACAVADQRAPLLVLTLRDADLVEARAAGIDVRSSARSAMAVRGPGAIAVDQRAGGCSVAVARPDDGAIDLLTLTAAGFRRGSLLAAPRPQALAWLPTHDAEVGPPPLRLAAISGTAAQLTIFELDSATAPAPTAQRRLQLPAWPTAIHATPWANWLVGAATQANVVFLVNEITAELETIAAGNGPFDVQLGDLDHDGISDFVVSEKFDDTLAIYRGLARGGALAPPRFQRVAALATGQGPSALRLADLDGDQRLDLVVLEAFQDTVAIHYGGPVVP